jgi:hypothetical protein
VILIRHLARVIVGVAFMAASLMLASSGALAHAGHRHHAPQHHESVHKHVPAVQAYGQAVHRHGYFAHRHAHAVASALASDAVHAGLASPDATSGTAPEKSQECPGCCCCIGVGCGAAWLSAPACLIAPTPGAYAPELRAEARTGVTPDALPEPPRTLV